MNPFVIDEFTIAGMSGRPVEAQSITRERIHETVLELLEASTLCSIATVTPERAAHANTAFFARSDALEVLFLSHPASRHCQNLRANPSIALTVFSFGQQWSHPGRGLQLFGTGEEASGSRTVCCSRGHG